MSRDVKVTYSMSKQVLVDDLPIMKAELPVLLPICIQPLITLSNDNAHVVARPHRPVSCPDVGTVVSDVLLMNVSRFLQSGRSLRVGTRMATMIMVTYPMSTL